MTARQLSHLIGRIKDNTLNSKTAKTVFEALLAGEGEADAIIEFKGLVQVTTPAQSRRLSMKSLLKTQTKSPTTGSPRGQKEQDAWIFCRARMKKSQGKAKPQAVNQILSSKLSLSHTWHLDPSGNGRISIPWSLHLARQPSNHGQASQQHTQNLDRLQGA